MKIFSGSSKLIIKTGAGLSSRIVQQLADLNSMTCMDKAMIMVPT